MPEPTNTGTSLPRVDAIAAKDTNGRLWLEITNLDPSQPVEIEAALAGITAKSATGETLTAPKVDSVNTFDAPNAVIPRPISAKNAAAARSYLPRTVKKADLVLAGRTKAQMVETIAAAIYKKELPVMEPGVMSYLLSKDSNLGDGNGRWHPHLMFFFSQADPATWGADLPGSPIIAVNDTGST